MVRLTPADYRMQVVSPFERSLQGYQAGFGQMQQLNEVRRQRVADQQAAQLNQAQLAYTQAQTSALEREKQTAQQVQDLTGQIMRLQLDGAPASQMKPLYQQLATLTGDDAHFQQFARLDSQEKTQMLSASAERYNVFDNMPIDQSLSYLETQIQAAPPGSEQRAGLEALYGLTYAAERAEPGSGADIAKATIRANAGILAATDEAAFGLFETLFDVPEPEKPSAFGEQLQTYLEAQKLQLGRELTPQEEGRLKEQFMEDYGRRGQTEISIGMGADGPQLVKPGAPGSGEGIFIDENNELSILDIEGGASQQDALNRQRNRVRSSVSIQNAMESAVTLTDIGALEKGGLPSVSRFAITRVPLGREFVGALEGESDAVQDFNSSIRILAFNAVGQMGLASRNFDTEKEFERILSTFVTTEYYSTLHALDAFDILYGDGNALDNLFINGDIDFDTYETVRRKSMVEAPSYHDTILMEFENRVASGETERLPTGDPNIPFQSIIDSENYREGRQVFNRMLDRRMQLAQSNLERMREISNSIITGPDGTRYLPLEDGNWQRLD